MPRFTAEELKGLEQIVFEEPFTCDTVVRLIDGVRQVFHNNKGRSLYGLHDYACDVDQYFGTTLFDPVCGFEHISVKRTETLKLDLQKLVFLRENGMPARNEVKRTESMYDRIFKKAKEMLQYSLLPTFLLPKIPYEKRLEEIALEMEEKADRYEVFKKLKYKRFFEEAAVYDWSRYHAELQPPLALIPAEISKPDTAPVIPVVDRLLRVTSSDRVNAQVIESVYQKNLRIWTTTQYSGAPPLQQASSVL